MKFEKSNSLPSTPLFRDKFNLEEFLIVSNNEISFFLAPIINLSSVD